MTHIFYIKVLLCKNKLRKNKKKNKSLLSHLAFFYFNSNITYFDMSIEILPVEIFYRILDRLNFKEIQFSFRFVCKRFLSIADNYPRMKFDFNYQTSNIEIQQLCRLVRPENIIELSLQNSYFNSNVIYLSLSAYTTSLIDTL